MRNKKQTKKKYSFDEIRKIITENTLLKQKNENLETLHNLVKGRFWVATDVPAFDGYRDLWVFDQGVPMRLCSLESKDTLIIIRGNK